MKDKFFVRRNLYHFGYDLCERFFKPNGHIDYVKSLFHLASEKEAIKGCSLLNNNKKFIPDKEQKFNPVILNLKEKHSDKTFLLYSITELYDVSLSILNERFLSGWYYDVELELIDKNFKVIEPEILDKLNDSMKKSYLDSVKEFEKNKSQAQEIHKQYLEIKKAINEGNGEMALLILKERSRENEYEEIEFVDYYTINNIK